MRKGIFVGVAALLALSAFAHAGTIAPPAGATAVFSDNFEGYADIAAVKANWAANSATAVELINGFGVGGGNAILSAGTAAGYLHKTIPTQTLTDRNPIVVEVDMWDYKNIISPTGGVLDPPVIASRDGVDIRNAGASAVYQFGPYNSMDDWSKYPLAGVSTAGYGFRNNTASAPGIGGWFVVNKTRQTFDWTNPSYHHLKMVLGSSSSRFEMTMANGWKYTKVIAQKADTYGKTLNSLRLGLTVSSTGKVIYDNIQVYTIPEPASMLLLGLGGLLLRRRRA